MNLGLCTIALQEESIEDALATAADAGYDGVELWGKDHVGAPERCHEIRETAAELGLEIPVYGSYLRPGTPEYDEEVETELERAETLGASLIRVWAGQEEYQDATDDHWADVVRDTTDLADRAADRGLGVTVEKHEGTVTNTEAGARELIEGVDRENCGLNWQPLFEFDAETILEEARSLAPLSNNVHLQAVAEHGDSWHDRSLLEDAYFDVPTILEAFAETGFDGYVEVEFVTDDLEVEAAIERDREFLESVVGVDGER
ncbi:sugar phosphate isomerase/epimerase [Natronoglomus mannanivorans]|uniref:Sugar phosphate isomerase/epimerase n=1 Tax=Natronoglomus mannanivorans TaxID=2979990 RepID=A0AAP2Z0R2_9EURY|nr:sugar phosphate isomerase/epimerase [Halobacteria archaeon AArc-xg1-1]